MKLQGKLKKYVQRQGVKIIKNFTKHSARSEFSIKAMEAQGAIASHQLRSIDSIDTLADVEFSIFSQWGEDGIIEWLIQRLPAIPQTFIEFGVSNYIESNTRFLLANRNWSGLILDGSEENIKEVMNDPIYWRHDIAARAAFVTCKNINALIAEAGLSGNVGLLSIDIDGMDYWVWREIENVRPWIVIVEYNAVYGNIHPIVTPYDEDFVRTRSHSSGLYCGASIRALTYLGEQKGYTLLGSNRAGNNAFFVKNDVAEDLLERVSSKLARPSRIREARDESGKLTFARGMSRANLISECPVVDIKTGSTEPLRAFGNLYELDWA